MPDPESILSRRRLIGGAVALAALGLAGFKPRPVEAGPARRTLNLYNPRTREGLRTTYRVGNKYSRNSLRQVNEFMRDWRSGESARMDPEVIDYLYSLQRWLGVSDPIHIVSGYRSKSTNAMLARKSGGVAKNSYHCKGMAIDLKIPNYSVSSIARGAEALKMGGVGRYSRSNFVHIDCADVRTWGR